MPAGRRHCIKDTPHVTQDSPVLNILDPRQIAPAKVTDSHTQSARLKVKLKRQAPGQRVLALCQRYGGHEMAGDPARPKP